MKNDKSDWKEVLGLILGTLIFATLTLPILHLSGVHDLLVRLSVESSKVLLQLFGYPST